MDVALILSLVGFAFMTTITPGPNNFLLMSSGALFGWRKTLPHILGIQFGFIALLSAFVFGLGLVVADRPWLVTIAKLIGAAWLFWMAIQFFRMAFHLGRSKAIPVTKVKSRPFRFYEAALFQWANPKAVIIGLSVGGGFIGLSPSLSLRALIISITFLLCGSISSTTWTLAGSYLNQHMSSGQSAVFLNLLMGILLSVTAALILSY
jgi:threonine/homoserine/homoserine lactone efflux protein